ncbi:hypothetical protein VSX60_10690 [Aurantimonas sp. A3-2-R12]|nr:hypothetical protein [Aurantimonas sp. A3-2-R12]
MELGENVREHLDAASRLPGAEAFVHIAVAVVALKRDDQPVADRALSKALTIRPELTHNVIKYSFYFPKWPALVAGITVQLDRLVEMGLPPR